MQRIAVLMLFTIFMTPMMPSSVFSKGTQETAVVDVGNKMCPVMGGEVNGKDFVDYNGKRYGLCCPGCKATFLSDPEKYIAQMEAQGKASDPTSAGTPDVSESEKMEHGMEQSDL